MIGFKLEPLLHGVECIAPPSASRSRILSPTLRLSPECEIALLTVRGGAKITGLI